MEYTCKFICYERINISYILFWEGIFAWAICTEYKYWGRLVHLVCSERSDHHKRHILCRERSDHHKRLNGKLLYSINGQINDGATKYNLYPDHSKTPVHLWPWSIPNELSRPRIFIHSFLSPAAPKARDGRYCNAPRPSVRLSVCLSVCPSVRHV